MARTLHKASASVGFRARFMLTDDPRPRKLSRTLPANRFLWNDVDIWATRYHNYFGRVPILRKLQRRGVESWWYTYANSWIRQMPHFVLEKPLADQRAWGWLMHQWKVEGLLYWATNRWGSATNGRGYRDPYRDPLSYQVGAHVYNGEAMLIYPGYYPRYGLDHPLAPPVSSLRLEALRDGLEDLEYMKMAEVCERGARRFVRDVVKTITWYPSTRKLKFGRVYTYPRYRRTQSWYSVARRQLAERIEPYWSGGANSSASQSRPASAAD